ncbi:MAG: hypothetical protein N2Z21_08620 [Candidatus Sumerlaeaceae bacterium]|nr:hypothetical protein [Candidatus Sumerlaeaceae bacterium]
MVHAEGIELAPWAENPCAAGQKSAELKRTGIRQNRLGLYRQWLKTGSPPGECPFPARMAQSGAAVVTPVALSASPAVC